MTADPPGEQLWRPNRKQAALALGGVIAVVVGLLVTLPKDKERPLRRTTVSRPSQSTAAPPTPSDAANPGGPVSTDGASVPATSAASGVPARPALGAASKPAPGPFVYRRTVASDGERRETEVSWTVTHLDGERVEHASNVERREGPNYQGTRVTERWSPSSVTRTAMQFPAPEGEEPRRCEFEPPLLMKPLPLEVGLKWESASACGEGRRRAHEEISGHVVRTERLRVAGVELDTIVIEAVSGRGIRGLFWFATEGTQWYSPELGVTVRSTEVQRETESNQDFRQDISTELLDWPGRPAADGSDEAG